MIYLMETIVTVTAIGNHSPGHWAFDISEDFD